MNKLVSSLLSESVKLVSEPFKESDLRDDLYTSKKGKGKFFTKEMLKETETILNNVNLNGVSTKKNITDTDVDPDQLRKGIEVEYEHTDDPVIAKRIALDHLAELPDYYDRLEKMEREGKEELGLSVHECLTGIKNLLENDEEYVFNSDEWVRISELEPEESAGPKLALKLPLDQMWGSNGANDFHTYETIHLISEKGTPIKHIETEIDIDEFGEMTIDGDVYDFEGSRYFIQYVEGANLLTTDKTGMEKLKKYKFKNGRKI